MRPGGSPTAPVAKVGLKIGQLRFSSPLMTEWISHSVFLQPKDTDSRKSRIYYTIRGGGENAELLLKSKEINQTKCS
jgi:hypothetical protein